jgi:uncharacterized membrane protein
MSLISDLHDAEKKLLQQLRESRRKQRETAPDAKPKAELTAGQAIADWVAATMGSWPFIIGQSIVLAFWIVLNVTAVIQRWDPYPFILLNLMLSFQAAYAAPFIMMAQNRQQDIDRKEAESDYKINIKAELEIEALHQKLDALRENEILLLTQTVADLTQLLKQAGICGEPATAAALQAMTAAKPKTAAKAPAAKAAVAKKPAPKKPAAKKPAPKKPAARKPAAKA